MSAKLRKTFFWLMFFTIVFTISYAGLYYREETKNPDLQDSFLSAGANFVNSEVYVWCNADKLQDHPDGIVSVAEGLSESVGVLKEKDYTINTLNNDFIRKTEIRGSTLDGKTVCIISQLNKSESDENDSSISVDIISELTQTDIYSTAKLLEEKFKSFGLNPKVNTCITGYFDGKLDYMEMSRISGLILKDAKAKKIDGMSEKNMISVSAYSPLIDNNIEIMGRMTNINLALRYNAYEDKTYIWVATPVITIEY